MPLAQRLEFGRRSCVCVWERERLAWAPLYLVELPAHRTRRCSDHLSKKFFFLLLRLEKPKWRRPISDYICSLSQLVFEILLFFLRKWKVPVKEKFPSLWRASCFERIRVKLIVAECLLEMFVAEASATAAATIIVDIPMCLWEGRCCQSDKMPAAYLFSAANSY